MRGQGADGAAGSNRQGLGEHGEGTGEPWEGFEQERAGSGLCLGRPLSLLFGQEKGLEAEGGVGEGEV